MSFPIGKPDQKTQSDFQTGRSDQKTQSDSRRPRQPVPTPQVSSDARKMQQGWKTPAQHPSAPPPPQRGSQKPPKRAPVGHGHRQTPG